VHGTCLILFYEEKRDPMRHQGGRVEVIAGSMFSGKTEELIRRLRRAHIAQQKIQVFKPSLDTRYGEGKLASHSGAEFEATPIGKAEAIFGMLNEDTTVVAIDEAQFFDPEITHVVQDLAERGLRVIVAGLDMDFRGEPFGPIPIIMSQSEEVDKLQAICMVCGGPASRTQRLIDGAPAKYDDPIVIVGASELYEARCRAHHEVPGEKS
jgi:thymidine kinase